MAPGSGGGSGAEPVAAWGGWGSTHHPYLGWMSVGSPGVSKRDAGTRWELAGKVRKEEATWDRNQRALRPQGYSQIPQELGVRALASHRRLLPGVEEERPEARGRSWGQLCVDSSHGQWCLEPLPSRGRSGLCPRQVVSCSLGHLCPAESLREPRGDPAPPPWV